MEKHGHRQQVPYNDPPKMAHANNCLPRPGSRVPRLPPTPSKAMLSSTSAAPKSNHTYARISGDLNPIHVSPYFAALVCWSTLACSFSWSKGKMRERRGPAPGSFLSWRAPNPWGVQPATSQVAGLPTPPPVGCKVCPAGWTEEIRCKYRNLNFGKGDKNSQNVVFAEFWGDQRWGSDAMLAFFRYFEELNQYLG